MKFTILIFTILSFFLVGSLSAQKKRPKKKTPPKPAKFHMNDEIIYEPDAEMLSDMEKKVRVVESKEDWAQFNRQAPIVNSARTRSAYIAQFKLENEPKAMLDVIVIDDQATGKMYEIRGIEDFAWRPFSDLKWFSKDVLQFEQWVNPTSGGRYQVNLKTGKIVAAGYVRSN